MKHYDYCCVICLNHTNLSPTFVGGIYSHIQCFVLLCVFVCLSKCQNHSLQCGKWRLSVLNFLFCRHILKGNVTHSPGIVGTVIICGQFHFIRILATIIQGHLNVTCIVVEQSHTRLTTSLMRGRRASKEAKTHGCQRLLIAGLLKCQGVSFTHCTALYPLARVTRNPP